MIRKPAPAAAGILVLAISAALAASCAQTEDSIFSSLAKETDVEEYSSSALVGSSPGAITRLGDTFYLAAGALFSRPLQRAADAWTAIASLPEAAPRCIELASDGVNLIAALRDRDYMPAGLWTSPDGGTWTQVSDAALNDLAGNPLSINRIMVLNGQVFLSVTDTAAAADADPLTLPWKLLRLAADYSVAATELALGPVEGSPWENGYIRDGAWDGTDYWFISGFSLYRGAAGALAALTGELGMPSNQVLKSIEWSAELGRLFVVTGGGMSLELTADETDDAAATELIGSTPGLVYARVAAGGSWEASAAISLLSASDAGYANFTDLAVVPGAAGTGVLIVGTEPSLKWNEGTGRDQKAASAKGYATLIPGADSSISGVGAAEKANPANPQISSWSNFETTLYPLILTRLVALDGGSGSTALFALSAGGGLWSNNRSAEGLWQGWFKE